MDILDLFWLICKFAVALIMFAAACYGLFLLFGLFVRTMVNRGLNQRVKSNRDWLLSLDQVHLLSLTTEQDTGLDVQDKDGIIQLALEKDLPEGQKDAIINRIAKHLKRQYE